MSILIFLFAILELLVTFFALVFVNWWAPLFAYDGVVSDRGVETKGPRLPEWLAWFDTFDATLDAGLAPGAKSTYWTRMKWLYRNSAYGFSYWVLGVKFDPALWTIAEFVPDGTGDVLRFRAEGPSGQYNLNYQTDHWHIKIGWKAWNMYDHTGETWWMDKPWGPEMRIPFVFSISPVRK